MDSESEFGAVGRPGGPSESAGLPVTVHRPRLTWTVQLASAVRLSFQWTGVTVASHSHGVAAPGTEAQWLRLAATVTAASCGPGPSGCPSPSPGRDWRHLRFFTSRVRRPARVSAGRPGSTSDSDSLDLELPVRLALHLRSSYCLDHNILRLRLTLAWAAWAAAAVLAPRPTGIWTQCPPSLSIIDNDTEHQLVHTLAHAIVFIVSICFF